MRVNVKRYTGFGSALLVATLLTAALSPVPAQAGGDDAGWLIAQLNCLRQSLGVGPLTINPALNHSATVHSSYLATASSISDYHTQPDGSTPHSRAAAAGYSGYVGENVVAGNTVAQAFDWWRGDDIHYRNMTNSYWSDVGVGIVSGPHGTWYTLDFGTAHWAVNRVPVASCGSFSASVGAAASSPASAPTAGSSKAPASSDSLDTNGNIRHPLQSGETLGSLALLYGYTWADIPAFLTLNHMMAADFRKLQIGSVFLIPPKAGTFTPAPNATAPIVITAAASGTDSPTVSAIPSQTAQSVTNFTPIPTETETATALPLPVTVLLTSTTTPTLTPTDPPVLAGLAMANGDQPSADNPIRALLPWAIVAQGVLLGGLLLRAGLRQR